MSLPEVTEIRAETRTKSNRKESMSVSDSYSWRAAEWEIDWNCEIR